jgi:bifunctional non-homologous end joining protein LigD
MSLKEYARKRDFEKTPEPKGSESPKSKPARRSFYVQRHDATRLHYDLRLEIGGTLKSWAVPYYAWGNRAKGEMTVWIPRTH